MEKTCIIKDCNWKSNSRWVFVKWYCNTHYQRYFKRWDPNIVKTKVWENRKKHYLYRSYNEMKKRCYNIKSKSYKHYWLRWIKVCDRRLWIDWFTNFVKDMWKRTQWSTLDRIDNNWNYEPNNCRWADIYTQSNNKRWIWLIYPWVSYSKREKKFKVSISFKWERVNLWTYSNEYDAILVRISKEKELWISVMQSSIIWTRQDNKRQDTAMQNMPF